MSVNTNKLCQFIYRGLEFINKKHTHKREKTNPVNHLTYYKNLKNTHKNGPLETFFSRAIIKYCFLSNAIIRPFFPTNDQLVSCVDIELKLIK